MSADLGVSRKGMSLLRNAEQMMKFLLSDAIMITRAEGVIFFDKARSLCTTLLPLGVICTWIPGGFSCAQRANNQ